MIKNIIFDLGHVLIDIDPKRSLQAFAQLANHQTTTPLITREGLLGGHTSQLIDLYQTGQVTTEQFCSMALQACRPETTPAQILDAWLAMLLPFQEKKAQLLRNLHAKGIPFYILSNINEAHVAWTRQHCPELQLSAGLFYSNEMHLAKPDSQAYQYLLDQTGIRPTETLYIDDLPANIEAGKQFGFEVIQATDDQSWMPQVQSLIPNS